MIQVYHSGCNCGAKGQLIRKVQSYGRKQNIEVQVLNSKYDSDVRFDHLNWLRLNGMDTSTLQPIVVENNVLRLLSAWKPS